MRRKGIVVNKDMPLFFSHISCLYEVNISNSVYKSCQLTCLLLPLMTDQRFLRIGKSALGHMELLCFDFAELEPGALPYKLELICRDALKFIFGDLHNMGLDRQVILYCKGHDLRVKVYPALRNPGIA